MFLRFQWNLVCRWRSKTDAWRYAVKLSFVLWVLISLITAWCRQLNWRRQSFQLEGKCMFNCRSAFSWFSSRHLSQFHVLHFRRLPNMRQQLKYIAQAYNHCNVLVRMTRLSGEHESFTGNSNSFCSSRRITLGLREAHSLTAFTIS